MCARHIELQYFWVLPPRILRLKKGTDHFLQKWPVLAAFFVISFSQRNTPVYYSNSWIEWIIFVRIEPRMTLVVPVRVQFLRQVRRQTRQITIFQSFLTDFSLFRCPRSTHMAITATVSTNDRYRLNAGLMNSMHINQNELSTFYLQKSNLLFAKKFL